MIKIKQIGFPPAGAHWSYGPDHMRQISRATAQKLCGMYPLPRMGYETIVAVAAAPSGFGKLRLEVQNVSGAFYVASCHTPVKDWPDVFKVEVTK